ncbi:unnamed protein product [Blepharisma stoltei]|uniref:Uncharacterized protein n=1 Tax=Blepharisma stoltei TaxID=1481888 RepID=A0AAU9JQU5_9CILI|nr:unnamed protein product [Blepharisma stoltei]
MSNEFYQRYHRLFFEDDSEPISMQYFLSKNPKNRINLKPSTDILSLAQEFEIIPKDVTQIEPAQPKFKQISAIEAQPVSKAAVKLPFSESPAFQAKPTFQPAAMSPPKRIIEYQPQPDNTGEVFKSMYTKQPLNIQSPTFQPQPPQQQAYESTRNNIFPDQPLRPQSKPISPYQTALNRRKDAKKNNEYRKERLRELLSMDKVPLGKLNK